MTRTTEQQPSVENDPAAHDVLRGAHDGSYRFPAGFPGFSAEFSVVESGPSGSTSTSGKIDVVDAKSVEIAGADGELADFVKKEVASMAGHRWGTPYEQGDGRWTLTIAEDNGDPLGRLIAVHDDPLASTYRVRAGRISQVARSMGPMSFTISMQSHIMTSDGEHLPETFTVTFWDAGTGRMTRSDIYTDRYERVGGVTLPAFRRVLTATDSGIVGREIELSNWRLRS